MKHSVYESVTSERSVKRPRLSRNLNSRDRTRNSCHLAPFDPGETQHLGHTKRPSEITRRATKRRSAGCGRKPAISRWHHSSVREARNALGPDYHRTKFSSPLVSANPESVVSDGHLARFSLGSPWRRGTRKKRKRKKQRHASSSRVTFSSTTMTTSERYRVSFLGKSRRTHKCKHKLRSRSSRDVSTALLLRERISQEERNHAIRWTHLRGQQQRRLIRSCVIRTVHSGLVATRLRCAHIRGLEFITSSNLYLFAVSCPPTPPGLAPCRSHLPARTWHLTSPAASSNTCHLAKVRSMTSFWMLRHAAPRQETARTICSHVDTSFQGTRA